MKHKIKDLFYSKIESNIVLAWELYKSNKSELGITHIELCNVFSNIDVELPSCFIHDIKEYPFLVHHCTNLSDITIDEFLFAINIINSSNTKLYLEKLKDLVNSNQTSHYFDHQLLSEILTTLSNIDLNKWHVASSYIDISIYDFSDKQLVKIIENVKTPNDHSPYPKSYYKLFLNVLLNVGYKSDLFIHKFMECILVRVTDKHKFMNDRIEFETCLVNDIITQQEFFDDLKYSTLKRRVVRKIKSIYIDRKNKFISKKQKAKTWVESPKMGSCDDLTH